MKQYFLSFFLLTIPIFAADTTPQTTPATTPQNNQISLLDKTMRQVKEAFRRWRICLVSHQRCTEEERQLLVEATNLLLERVLQETVYVGATIGEQLTKSKE